MSNRFVIVEKPRDYSVENFYDTLSRSYLDYVEIKQAHKQLERGFEAFDVLSNLRNVIKKNNTLTPGLESSLNQTVLFYKDILGDYSTNISLESYNDSRVKRSVALEGIGDWLKKIWEAIANFFKNIWNWLFGKSNSGSSGSGVSSQKIEKQIDEYAERLLESEIKKMEAEKKADKLKRDTRYKELDDELKNLNNDLHEKVSKVANKIPDHQDFVTHVKDIVSVANEANELLKIKIEQLAFIDKNYAKYIAEDLTNNKPSVTRRLMEDCNRSTNGGNNTFYDLVVKLNKNKKVFFNNKTIEAVSKTEQMDRYISWVKNVIEVPSNQRSKADEEIYSKGFGGPVLTITDSPNTRSKEIEAIYFIKNIESISKGNELSAAKSGLEKTLLKFNNAHIHKSEDPSRVFKLLKISEDDIYLTEEESKDLEPDDRINKQNKKIRDSHKHDDYRKEITFLFKYISDLGKDVATLRNFIISAIDWSSHATVSLMKYKIEYNEKFKKITDEMNAT